MTSHSCDVARREVLRLGLYAGGLAALGVPMSFGGIARAAEAAASGRILVVVELSGAKFPDHRPRITGNKTLKLPAINFSKE